MHEIFVAVAIVAMIVFTILFGLENDKSRKENKSKFNKEQVQELKDKAPEGFELQSYSITGWGHYIPVYTKKTSETLQLEKSVTHNVDCELVGV